MWHMVRAQVRRCRLGDGPIFSRYSICFALELTLRELHDILFAGHAMVDLYYRRVFRFQTLNGYIIRRQDSKVRYLEQGSLACTKLIHNTWCPSIGYIQVLVMRHRWAPTISSTSLQQSVIIRVAQRWHYYPILSSTWDPGIIGLDSSATIMDERVLIGEDHSDLPLDFSLVEIMSLLSDSLMVSKVIVVSLCRRGPFSTRVGLYFHEFTLEVNEVGFPIEQLLEEMAKIMFF